MALLAALACSTAACGSGTATSVKQHAQSVARIDGRGGGEPTFPVNGATSGGSTSAITWAETFEDGGAAAGQASQYAGWCLAFVANAYGSQFAGYNSAWDMAQALTLNDANNPAAAPRGSLMFFGPNSYNDYDGHVGISLGGGQMISANEPSATIPGVVLNYPTPNVQSSSYWSQLYRGWAWPPSNWGPLAQQAASGDNAAPADGTASSAPDSVNGGGSGGLTVTTHPNSPGTGSNLQAGANPQPAGGGSTVQNGANPQPAGNGQQIQDAPQNPSHGSGGGGSPAPTQAPPSQAPPTKALTVDASYYFGNCTSPNNPSYCGADAHSQSSPNFNKNAEGNDWPGGTQTTGLCWTTGGSVNAPASGATSNVWIETTLSSSYPWMSELYFQPGAASGLDHC